MLGRAEGVGRKCCHVFSKLDKMLKMTAMHYLQAGMNTGALL